MSAQTPTQTPHALGLINRAAPELAQKVALIVASVQPVFAEDKDSKGMTFGTLYNRIFFTDRANKYGNLVASVGGNTGTR